MSLDAVPQLDHDATYELCPDCGGIRGHFDFLRRVWTWFRRDHSDPCTTCWDEGLIPHACGEED